MVGSNPFFHRAPVRDPAYFFGREHEIAQLFDLLGRGQSVSISGQRRLGKTSLLFHAALPEVAASHGIDPGRIRWVYLDGGMLDGLDDEAVYGAIVRSMGGDESDTSTYARFLERVRALAAQSLRLIVALDEFEIFAQNLKFQPQLFNRLRGLTNQFPVQFVTASKEPLARLSFANPAAVSSAFVGIFAPFRLPLFQEHEAVEMLTVLSARSGSEFRADTIGLLLELVGPHPHFLQVAGYHAFRLQENGVLSANDRSALRERVLDELKGHLEYYWRDLSADEQYTLAAMPVMAFETHSPTMERLADGGLIHENKYLGAVLREFVARQSVDGVLRRGAFAMDERRRLIAADGVLVHLTPTEFAAMRLLMQSPGRVLTPEEIEASLWPDEVAPDLERARGIMKKLRTALGEAGTVIVTHRGQGYSLQQGT